MVEEIKPIAELVGSHAEYRAAAKYVTGLDVLPLARVVNDEKVTDHHAIIPTRSEHKLEKMDSDDRRIYDMAARRFLAVFHPEAVFENTRVETTVDGAEEVGPAGSRLTFRTRGKVLLVPGWRGVYDEAPGRRPRAARSAPRRTRTRPTSSCRDWRRASRSTPARSRARARKPNRRGATATRPCWERWRPPASSSTTTSCARR